MIWWVVCRIIFTMLCCLNLIFLSAQEVKPPVAEDDYAETFMTNPVSVNVLINDHAYEGDVLVIQGILDVVNGWAWYQDSIIHFIPLQNGSLAQHGKVYYMIKDLTTGLLSAEGEVTIALRRVKHRVFNPNGIRARINAVGNQFMVLDSFSLEAPNHFFEAPAMSGKNTIYSSALWIAGRDVNGNIHSACERLRKGKLPYASNTGWDFWTGPVMEQSHYNPDYLVDHNRLYYMTRYDVLEHISHCQDPGYFPSGRINKWPASGYPEMGTAEILAPFTDVNKDGKYDPLLGDYPRIKGDEAVYFIFNDDFAEHTESFGRKFGMEVQGMAYAFRCVEDSAFNNTLFVRYQAINRSDTTYHSVYIGNYTHFAIGTPDDYLVCDSLQNAVYAYNRDVYDSAASQYYPAYGAHPPAQAVVLLNRPVDHFMYFYSPWPPSGSPFNGVPTDPEEYYNYMKSIWTDGTHLTYGDDGHGAGPSVDHALTGDPISGTGWLEKDTGLDEVLFGVASSGPYNFFPGDTLTLELAYVFARDYEGDHLSSLGLLKERVEKVRWYYANDSTPCATPWTGLKEEDRGEARLLVEPNPAATFIRLSGQPAQQGSSYQIHDITGTLLREGRISGGQKIDISSLSPGCYIVRLYNLERVFASKFIKID